MLTLEISTKDIEIARQNRTMPATVAFERQFYFKMIRSGPVCAVGERRDGTWVKIRFPFSMWDWCMSFINGDTPPPVVLQWAGSYSGEESIIRDLTAKDFRHAERVTAQVVEAEIYGDLRSEAHNLPAD